MLLVVAKLLRGLLRLLAYSKPGRNQGIVGF